MRYVFRPGHPLADEHNMVEAHLAGPKHASDAAPNVITDSMAPLRHMATGITSDSKAHHRQMTRDSGCVEVGTEISTVTKPKKPLELSREQRRNDIRRVISQLR